ncbi:hypothetical protein OS175_01245 [Marinicella sp. S1101]|uniref:hypothetical protein n=1 Tax=Marinicella marina TaxID=2996016 RepID=UPI002260AEFA|nr:hypothetical protein [Marinicella marina]MCX7552487.1 hypothetical protein [Marinicella marina]MDJ1139363.1 hypothetical protein [Marinicella marina]
MKKLLLGMLIFCSLLVNEPSQSKTDPNGCTSMGVPFDIEIGYSIGSTGSFYLDAQGFYKLTVRFQTYSICQPSGLAVLIGSYSQITMEGGDGWP